MRIAGSVTAISWIPSEAIDGPGVPFEVLRTEPEISGDNARFVQTVGGRAGFPAPRLVKGGPIFRIHAATAWTTLTLTLYTDGRVEHDVVGASPFPRLWIYDSEGNLVGKSGIVDFKRWYRESHGDNTPWGDEESPALVAAAETGLDRQVSASLLGGDEKLHRRDLGESAVLVTQGAEGGDTLYLILDGVFGVEVDGEKVAEMGPGRSSASARRSRAASAPRRSAPSRVAVSS